MLTKMNCRNGNFWRSHNEPTRLPVNSQLGWSSKFQNGEFKLAIEFTVCWRHHGKFLYSNFNQSRSLYDSNCHSIRLIGKTFNEKRNMWRSVKFRMNLWGHCFSQNENLKLQGFLPYQTNKDRSTFFWWL